MENRDVGVLEKKMDVCVSEIESLSRVVSIVSPRVCTSEGLGEIKKRLFFALSTGFVSNYKYFLLTGNSYEKYINAGGKVEFILDSVNGELDERRDVLNGFDGRVYDEK